MPTLEELREARIDALHRMTLTGVFEADEALIAAQQQRIAALTEALEPFALMGEIFVNSTTIHPSYKGRDREIYSLNDVVLTRGNFEDAYDLLHADTGKKGE